MAVRAVHRQLCAQAVADEDGPFVALLIQQGCHVVGPGLEAERRAGVRATAPARSMQIGSWQLRGALLSTNPDQRVRFLVRPCNGTIAAVRTRPSAGAAR